MIEEYFCAVDNLIELRRNIKTSEVCILLCTCESILLIGVVSIQVNLSKVLIACWLLINLIKRDFLSLICWIKESICE